MFKELFTEAKAHGMNYDSSIHDEMKEIHKKLGSKSTGKVIGW